METMLLTLLKRSNATRVINRSKIIFLFQAEDGIRDVERSRGLGDVYKRRTTGVSIVEPLRILYA